MIKQHNPHLRYLRIHTTARNTATIYAWDEELRLQEGDAASLQRFAAGYLAPYVSFKVKAYPFIREDRVPEVFEVPDLIVQTALNRNLDQYGIIAVMNSMLSTGEITFTRYEINTGTFHFDIRTTTRVTDIEQELIQRYLYEIIPLGSRSAVSYVCNTECVI
ncbi:hypothetical protein [Cohnella kolymensis]|nr:hypothetical protein [Cohnella kolymensis]